MSVTEPAATASLQFQALLDLHSQALWPELIEAAARMLNEGGLSPGQRALVKHLQWDGWRQQGQREEADQVLGDVVALACAPLAGLQWLERQWEQGSPQQSSWVGVTQRLVKQGHGPAVLRTLMGNLSRLPLQAQREALIQRIEDSDALMLSSNPALRRQWHWLKQAAAGNGTIFWA